MVPSLTLDDTLAQLRHLVAQHTEGRITAEQIDPAVPLLEGGLNLDSLAIVELITSIEQRFGVQFGEDALTLEVFANLRSLATAILAQRNST